MKRHTTHTQGGANPGIFWYWNCDLTAKMIRGQLLQIHQAGFRSVCIHPMPTSFRPNDFHAGMNAPWMGRRYLKWLQLAVEICADLGIEVILYDEAGWPSGNAGGMVVKDNPEFGAQVLKRDELGQITHYNCTQWGWGAADLMNPKAVGKFIQCVHEKYRQALGSEFGRTIRGIFTDEPGVLGQIGTDTIPWSPEIPRIYRRLYGGNVQDILPLLFGPLEPATLEQSPQAREQYRRCYTALLRSSYYAQLKCWCRKNRLRMEGHFDKDDALSLHAASMGDFLECAGEFHVPGVDAIWRQIYPGKSDGAFVRLAQSAAIRYHRHDTCSESFQVYGSAATGEILNWCAGAQYIHGISRIMMMPFLASANGARKIACGTDFSPRNPLWLLLPALTAHWRWLGDYDPGALDAPVVVDYRPPLPRGEYTPDPQAEKLWNRCLEWLDDQWIFWRFASPDEKLSPGQIRINPINPMEWSKLPLQQCQTLQPMEPTGKFRVMPCRRRDGQEAVMIFCMEKGLFRFATEQHWQELLPPDPAPCQLSPLEKCPGGYQMRLERGESRIIIPREEGEELLPAPRRCQEVQLHWKISRALLYQLGNHPSQREMPVPKCEMLPENGDYTTNHPDFSGMVEMECTLECPEGALPQLLEFPDMWCGGRLTVNDVVLECRANPPWVFLVGKWLRPGVNHLRLQVASGFQRQWMKAYEEEWLPKNLANSYCKRIAQDKPEEARCGVSPQSRLYYL